MHGINPAPVNRRGFISQQGLMKIANAAMQFGLSGGPNDTVSSQGITAKPQLLDACFALVDDYEDNRHAWTEADVSDADNVRRMVGGRRGTIEASGSGRDDQTAWGLNGDFYNIDDVIYIVRINYNAWGIVGGLADGEGSNGAVPAYCDGVLTGYITIDGDSVSFTGVDVPDPEPELEPGFDDDAAAYFAANTGLTDEDTKTAINELFLDLKATSIYTKMKGLYLTFLGSSTMNKWNLVDPTDSDGAFRLSFVGGLTHSATGITSNGSTGGVNTHLVPSTDLSSSSGGFAIYNRTNTAGGYDGGCLDSGYTHELALISRYSNNNTYGDYGATYISIANPGSDSRGFWGLSHLSGTTTVYQDGSTVVSGSQSPTLSSEELHFLCQMRFGSLAEFTTREAALMVVYDGLDATEWGYLNAAVNDFMVAMGLDV